MQFKRFTDLTIENIPSTVRLVVLVGPNGCGKSSLFDAFKVWHLYKGYGNGSDNVYANKLQPSESNFKNAYDLVNLEFHDLNTGTDNHSIFYFRTAYRNEPSVKSSGIKQIGSPTANANTKRMVDTDETVGENYQRLVAKTLSKLYDPTYDSFSVSKLRDELVGKIRESMKRLFGDLIFSDIGIPTEKSELYFDKGATKKYGYTNLSGGEKAAFDLLFDFILKQDYYPDTVFCIDEPEAHIHTRLQADLLGELYSLVSGNSQLWIATHSFGMLKKAREIEKSCPGSVAFLDFEGYDFDETVIMQPTAFSTELWKRMLDMTLDEYSSFVIPECIVFCEGTIAGRTRQDFDARCYKNIFQAEYSNTLFYSLGGCNDIEKTQMIDFISQISSGAKIIRIIDRDDRSNDEISDLNQKGIKVLSRRHIESFLLDEEIIGLWCVSEGKPSLSDQALEIRRLQIEASVARGNPSDDVKSAGNVICTEIKKLLLITSCGNTGEAIMRDTLTRLITTDTQVYHQLKNDIFG